jgi:tRNA nucleotidyltransferase/poly(A) polymerase
MSDPLDALTALNHEVWLVGGALRDRLLGRPTADYDVAVAVPGSVRGTARRLARRTSGHAFKLSEGFGAWRVVAHDHSWQVDMLPVVGESIESDLAGRDLTVNAIAQNLCGGELIDPWGGLGDLQARRLRMVSGTAFADDPLRVLRLARQARELEFTIDRETGATATRSAQALSEVAPERILAELKRIVASVCALEGLRLMDELSITPVVLPELSALHGVEQSHFHHLDVYEHTLEVLATAIELERATEQFLGEHAEAVAEFLSRPLANELTRWHALRFAALLHDVAKPETRTVGAEGRVTFMGHDAAGSHMAGVIMSRLRASDRLTEYVAALTRHHLRLGFLVHQMPLSRRAIYAYLHECAPVPVDVTVLSVADRLATRGERSAEAIAKHLQLAEQLLGEALTWEADPPRPPVRGDELARALGVEPGPELGRILQELEQASFAGEISSEEEAVQRARELLQGGSIGSRG